MSENTEDISNKKLKLEDFQYWLDQWGNVENLKSFGAGLSAKDRQDLRANLEKYAAGFLDSVLEARHTKASHYVMEHASIVHYEAAHHEPNKAVRTPSIESREQRISLRKLFRFLELSFRLLPPKTRKEAFEPAYDDAKADYLNARRRYKTKLARRWLAFCFGMHVGLMLGKSAWGMCSEKIRSWFLSYLPEFFRRILGG